MTEQKTEQQQIEEIVNVITNSCLWNKYSPSECAKCKYYRLADSSCVSEGHKEAEVLYAAGYRKQSDTVREFAGKLLEKIQPFCFSLIGREIKMEIMETVGEFGAEVEE